MDGKQISRMPILPLAAGISLAACALSLAVSPARADITGCNVSSSGIIFSDYDIVSQPAVQTTGDVVVTCTGTGSGANNLVTVDLSAGSGACATRTMTIGGNTLNYNVYTDATYSVAWCTTTTLSHEFDFGVSSQHTFTMYGRVSGGQSVPWGTYSDSFTATANWPMGSGANAPVSITETAPAVCSLSAGSLDFGSYVGASTDATAALDITCSLNAPYTVSLDGGSNFSTTRRMAGPAGAFLGYSLYSDPMHTTAWGDNDALGARVGGTGSGNSQSLTVYGHTTAGQLPVPGSYADTVVVTLTY